MPDTSKPTISIKKRKPATFMSPPTTQFTPGLDKPADANGAIAVLVSYPKSGRTWLRFMLNACLCHAAGLETDNVFEAETKLAHLLWVQYTHLASAMLLERTYWETGPLQVQSDHAFKSVLLTRNARATLRSAYHQATARVGIFEGTPSAFIRDPRFGAAKLATFYHQVHCLSFKSLPGLTILQYERCLQNPAAALQALLEAMGLQAPQASIDHAVSLSTMDQMKQLGLTPAYANTPLAPADPDNPNSHKVRGGNEALFSDADLQYIDRVVIDLFPHALTPTYANLIGAPGPRK